jgi:hypothetical protein
MSRKPFTAPAVTSSVALSDLTLNSISGGLAWDGGNDGSLIRWIFRWLGGRSGFRW